ncbi:Helicase associated domain protein [Streptomyces anulatus]|nr:Helicase associated domain protein [Streptomyces anulatus]MCX4523303.1 Helicase associated domain protein [Streptomyces anulatus]MCX4598901.1 Helicase associated domain protein [Streptomyces anulatus]MCX4606313.1 Helicase associated domain protein [Streptomyces anulatus]
MQGITLRPHQVEAVDATVFGLSLPADGTLPVGGLRGQVHMATGTGKTLTAAMAALKLCPNGVIGVLVPTLDLLTQTIEAWRRAGHQGPAVAVCSLGADPLLKALGVRSTTNPTQLALWASGGPMLVFATYASLAGQGLADDENSEPDAVAPGVLEQALRGSYGQRMAPFDLLVVDEAHRSSGNASKAWACVHDQTRIPAARRLYMTATPRLWEAGPGAAVDAGEEADVIPPGGGEALGGRLVASMDDVALYGPVLHEIALMESVERGILARFEIDVLEIRDPSPLADDASLEERRGRRLAALQAALLKHADETGVRSYMTFHSRTLDAMTFARAMPETAARLHSADPAAYPARIGSEWLSGEHPATHRRDVLTRYADGLDADGWVCELSFLASCRVLGEGVDIRGKRGVGAVVFADTRSSPVEVVQIIGRALRQEPGDGKVSRIVVPVFLEPGEDPGDMMASSSYTGLVVILQGLRAHDDRVIERMALPTTTARGQITSVLALDPQQPPADEHDDEHDQGDDQGDEHESQEAGPGDDQDADADERQGDEEAEGQGDEETGAAPGIAGSSTPLLRFSLPRDPQTIALFLRTRVLRPDSEVWLTGYTALRGWVREHGHASVPSDTTIELGNDGDGSMYGLGSWVTEQRRAFRAGTLKPWRTDLLNKVGMVWSVGDAGFWKNLTAARDYYEAHSTLACPRNAVWDGVEVGEWLSNLRRPGGLGTDPVRADKRRRALEAIDPEWNPGWPVDWQRHYAAARALLGEEQGPADVLPGVTVNGVDVGTWTTKQTDPGVWDTLLPEQRERLTALGLTPRTAPAAPAGKEKGAGAFERGITALTQYAAREGRVVVPRTHVEETPHGPVRLGTWISNTRSRREKLSTQQREQLTALGIEWATAN